MLRRLKFILAITLGLLCVLPITHARPDAAAAKLASEVLRRGEELRRKWQLDAAEAAFHEAAALEPANLEARLGLARIARARFDYGRALSLLDKAVAGYPRSPDALIEYGLVYLAAEAPARARHYFESALRTSDSDPSAIVGLAGVDLLERNYEQAAANLRKCLTREPQNSYAHAMLARVFLEKDKNDDAAEEATRAIELDAYNVEALYALACAKSAKRKADEARSLARRAILLDPLDVRARRMLSQYLDGQKGYEQKVSEQARAHYHRGCALKQEAELTRAVAELEAALRVEPRYCRALLALGDAWLRQGDYARAAETARLATEMDPDSALAHLELSYAYRGLQERARIEIGGVDFAALFQARPAPPAYALTREIFPNYGALTKRQQTVIDLAVAPLAGFFPKLARNKARHYLLAFDQRPGDLHGFVDVAGEKTFDGRYYASIRGVGGRVTVSGIEYLDQAARGGFNTIAHEFAHQVHIAALGKSEVKEIRRLYEKARSEGRTLDYYAAANEYEYFAQGYEAFISDRKRPSAGVTGRHTNHELMTADPELYRFLLKLTGKPESSAAP